MTELLEELEQKRQLHNVEAERHRKARDELNEKTREWVEKRDTLNGKVRELVDQAAKHREARDQLNVKVRESKEQRDKWNKLVNELNEKVTKIKKDNLPKNGPPVSKLKKELKTLEFKQMTSVLSKEKEQEIIEQMGQLQAQIKEREKAYDQNEEVKNAIKELRDAKDQAESHHRSVSESAEKAQAEHDAMIGLYEQADALRKEADSAQESFIANKVNADEEHKKHIENIRQVHDYDKIIAGMRQKARKAKKKDDEASAKEEAEKIFDKFKAGEKLSTEDLMALQKSGYL
ncbi:MAG: phosphoserine phosphatase [Methanomassiliicoccus sp.]|nr:phosphoserine phosphatase [Methanomassiliicoccus sp.]